MSRLFQRLDLINTIDFTQFSANLRISFASVHFNLLEQIFFNSVSLPLSSVFRFPVQALLHIGDKFLINRGQEQSEQIHN